MLTDTDSSANIIRVQYIEQKQGRLPMGGGRPCFCIF